MATLTLGKSVTLDAVQSKKGDSVFVERRRRVLAPGSNELREEPAAPVKTRNNPADEKLRAVLEAAHAREEERRKREAEEAAARAAREAEIARENKEYEQVKEQLAARENVATPVEDDSEQVQEIPSGRTSQQFKKSQQSRRNDSDDEDTPANSRRNSKFGGGKKEFTKTGKISLHDIVMGDEDDEDSIGIRGANRRRSEASLKRFREKASIARSDTG